ncbi:MAG TPA: IclR family transcriptional regulator C-terminal domain-containing protein [Pseudorhodoferax sp.]|nr:IclR family transcriptional regulator C-terminal domain-containing protein [Pseudorhodoferax sp.]
MGSGGLHVGARLDFIHALAKGLAVLESFDTERQTHNATTAAQRAGITRTSARRYLLTLSELGYLSSQDGQWFALTPKVLRTSGCYLASARLPRVVQSTLNKLSLELGVVVSVAVQDDDQIVVVARSGTTQFAAYGIHLGARLRTHATSTGRVLLAALDDAQLQAWLERSALRRLTNRTTTDPAQLAALIREVRAQDYSLAEEEHELGICALAVPLRDMSGRVVAAMNLVFPAAHGCMGERQLPWLRAMRAAAGEIQALL